jgi:chromate transporter
MFTELARYFLTLGIIGFGGPPAHIALMRRDLVERKHWVTAAQFNEDLATANLLPGPTSTEMAIYIGYRMAGVGGAITSGVCFILPAFFIVLVLSIAYASGTNVTTIDRLLYAVKPVALALIISGTVQIGQPVLKSWREWALLGACLLAVLLLPIDVLLVFVIAGVALVTVTRGTQTLGLPAWLGLLPAQSGDPALTVQVFLTFVKIGALIYGGGFALVGILQQEVVLGTGWLTQQQLLDGIAIGQSTPGPVFTSATFVGYIVAGIPGAILATIGIFSPAFVFVVLENKLLANIKSNPLVQLFLRGVNVAVVATIAVSAAQLAGSALVDPLTISIFCLSLIGLVRYKLDALWLIGGGLLIGLSRLLLS